MQIAISTTVRVLEGGPQVDESAMSCRRLLALNKVKQ